MSDQELVKRPAEPATIAPLRGVRELPNNLEAEQAVLGAVLIEETAYDQVAALLKPEDFYLLAHQHVYTTFEELTREARSIDAITVQQRLDGKGLLGPAVPRDFVATLAAGLGTPGNVAHYATLVADLARLRRMMLVAQKVVDTGYESGAGVRDYLEAAQQRVFEAASANANDTLRAIKDVVIQATENLEKLDQRIKAGLSPITGIPTGLPTLDSMTLGFQPGTLVIIAARPSVGKTAFALNIAAYAATKGNPPRKVAFFSLEMPSDQLVTRMLASEARLDWRRISKGQLQRHDWEKILVHGEKLGSSQVWFDDNFALSPVDLRSKCRKLKRDVGLDLVVVDYLQLMHVPSLRASQSREQEIATISRSLKGLAKELGIPVIALSQLSRAVEKRKGEPPMLADLRESGAIEQDADIVSFLHRPEEDKDGPPAITLDVQEIQLIVAKQRQGPTGQVDLVFFRNQTFFAEKERRREGTG